MITEDEFYDAVDATLDKLEKEEEKVSNKHFIHLKIEMKYLGTSALSLKTMPISADLWLCWVIHHRHWVLVPLIHVSTSAMSISLHCLLIQ